jgi:hypothetical protein
MGIDQLAAWCMVHGAWRQPPLSSFTTGRLAVVAHENAHPPVLLDGELTFCLSKRQTRAAVYAAAGLDPETGRLANCSRAGRVRLKAEEEPGADPATSRLGVAWQGQWQPAQLTIADNTA